MKTKYRWIAQDADGRVGGYKEIKPSALYHQWTNYHGWKSTHNGTQNPNWQDSLIDLKKESYEIVDGILERRPKKVKLTDTQLLDAIVEHSLCVEVEDGEVWVITSDGRTSVFNEKGNIRKAIREWLKENVDKKHKQE